MREAESERGLNPRMTPLEALVPIRPPPTGRTLIRPAFKSQDASNYEILQHTFMQFDFAFLGRTPQSVEF